MAYHHPWHRSSRGRPVATASGSETGDGDGADGPDDALDPIGADDLFAALGEPAEDDSTSPSNGAAEPKPLTDVSPLVTDEFRTAAGLSRPPRFKPALRSYQKEAVDAWEAAGGRGLIVLPTGAGKTVVALAIAARLSLRTLVVAPTIDLLHQWRASLTENLGFPLDEVGIVGGGKRTIRDLTVITYDSAAMPRRRLEGFGFLIVDEVHHLPATAYRSIADKTNAPFRLGLSATPERADRGHEALDRLIGSIVYRRSAAELARDDHIASYHEKRLFVSLGAEERARYDERMGEYKRYLAMHRASFGRPDAIFTEMIRRSGHDPAARSALRAHREARMIALNATAKAGKVEELLNEHRDDKVIIFSEYNVMVDSLSERLLLPAITYRTPLAERRQTLDRFRAGEYSKLVTGRVLNEGVDVPDANVAVVVSGSSTTREYIQRLGRVLRPKRERAMLYELVTRQTTEGRSARKRHPRESLDPGRANHPSSSNAGVLPDADAS